LPTRIVGRVCKGVLVYVALAANILAMIKKRGIDRGERAHVQRVQRRKIEIEIEREI
jgi:hypothetical protein